MPQSLMRIFGGGSSVAGNLICCLSDADAAVASSGWSTTAQVLHAFGELEPSFAAQQIFGGVQSAFARGIAAAPLDTITCLEAGLALGFAPSQEVLQQFMAIASQASGSVGADLAAQRIVIESCAVCRYLPAAVGGPYLHQALNSNSPEVVAAAASALLSTEAQAASATLVNCVSRLAPQIQSDVAAGTPAAMSNLNALSACLTSVTELLDTEEAVNDPSTVPESLYPLLDPPRLLREVGVPALLGSAQLESDAAPVVAAQQIVDSAAELALVALQFMDLASPEQAEMVAALLVAPTPVLGDTRASPLCRVAAAGVVAVSDFCRQWASVQTPMLRDVGSQVHPMLTDVMGSAQVLSQRFPTLTRDLALRYVDFSGLLLDSNDGAAAGDALVCATGCGAVQSCPDQFDQALGRAISQSAGSTLALVTDLGLQLLNSGVQLPRTAAGLQAAAHGYMKGHMRTFAARAALILKLK